ncbi:glutathione S-transferase T3-like isoform X2 [Miscanthus floridulus]|uniref:glutathione S-transferase T3-like isoform X2 n=1 Tax=Miscanthus floridulus TaxID=154761 RepID=UPI003458162C
MSSRSKRQMAPPPPVQDGPACTFAPASQTGSAPAPTLHSSAPALLYGGGAAAVPTPGSQSAWWPGPLPQATPSAATSTNYGMDYYPPGGFLNILQSGQPFIPHVSATWPPMGKEYQLAPPKNDSENQNAKKRSKGKTTINLDDGNNGRTAKRLVFDPDEDVRLVSAWLIHSNDPINGNCKKNEKYWGDVHELYNKTTPINRKREVKHLKDRWTKIKKWVALFCGSWKKATSIYLSGYSDEQLKDMAKQFYLDDYKEGPFTVEHCWKILRGEPKWHAVLEELETPNKRSLDGEDEAIETSGTPEAVGEMERPMGTKKAKKQRSGKGRVNDDDVSLDEDLKKFIDIQAATKKRQEDFLEAQERISDKKFQTARLNRETALLDSYHKLLCMDTREMTEDIRAEHVLALKMLREKLASNSD